MHYRADIDGLRAVAVGGVLAFHFGLSWGAAPIFPGGLLGVDIFFVISGYLITRHLVGRPISAAIVLDFYRRRARRLLPALYLVCLTTLAAGLFILPPQSLLALAQSALAGLLFVSNFYFYWTTDYWSEAADLTPLIHLWSLSAEEQFYLLYPLALALLGTRGRLRAIVLALALGLSLAAALGNGANSQAVFYIVVFRVWELLAGALVALLHERPATPMRFRGMSALPWLGLGLTAGAFVLGGGYGSNIAAVLGAVLIIGFGRSDGSATRLLSLRPLVAIGLISYPLYLWHQPVLALARQYALTDLDGPTRLGLLAICLALAGFTWRFVELPVRHSTMPPRAAWTSIALASGGLLTACLAIIAFQGLPQRYSDEQRLLLAAEAERGTLVLAGQDCLNRSVDKPCHIGAPGKPATWAVLGDSHAETLADALSTLLAANDVAAELLTYPGCPFVLGVEPVFGSDACAAFADSVLAKLRADQIETVIIQDRGTAYFAGTRFDNGEGGVEPGDPFPMRPVGGGALDEATRIASVNALWSKTMTTLLDSGIQVIYIAPVPEVGWHVPRTAARLAARGGAPLTTSRERYLDRHRDLLAMVQNLQGHPGFVAIFPETVFCDAGDGRCQTQRDGRLLYTDTDHLSRVGGQLLVDAIGSDESVRNFLNVRRPQ
nr:acyltransferase family protein [uncultured Devosia sp.]